MRDFEADHDVQVLADASAVAREAARRFVLLAQDACAARGLFRVALAGGETPTPLYRILATRRDVDWGHVEVFWSDERAVPPEHPDSNYRVAHEALLAHVPVPASQVHRMPADWTDLERAARAYEALLRERLGNPAQLDLVLLGMGEDAHVASLFPGHDAVLEKQRLVVATPAPAVAPRLTLTFPVLDAARHVIFLVVGARKARAVQRALHGSDDVLQVPARGVRPRAGDVVWLLDREASGSEGPRAT